MKKLALLTKKIETQKVQIASAIVKQKNILKTLATKDKEFKRTASLSLKKMNETALKNTEQVLKKSKELAKDALVIVF